MPYAPYYNDYSHNPSPDRAERLQVRGKCVSLDLHWIDLAKTTHQISTNSSVCPASNEILKMV